MVQLWLTSDRGRASRVCTPKRDGVYDDVLCYCVCHAMRWLAVTLGSCFLHETGLPPAGAHLCISICNACLPAGGWCVQAIHMVSSH